MNLNNARLSRNFDIFHDVAAGVRENAKQDFDSLQAAGYQAAESQRSRPERGFIEAIISKGDVATEIQWVVDSAIRFFPVIEDKEFGWRLHDFDLAINKTLALAGRREPRDYYDLFMLEQKGVSLASLVWAAPAKDPGFTPDLLLEEIVRNSSYSEAEMRAKIDADPLPDLVMMKRSLLRAVHHARDVVESAPMDEIGLLYLDKDGRIVEPGDHTGLEIGAHSASLGGSWPIFPEKGSALGIAPSL